MGSGDARGPYRWARSAPDWCFLAADANPDAMREMASRAGRKPARGGIGNLICVAEPFSVLAEELSGIANRLSVILPWGGLLSAVALPELHALKQLRRLCASGARVEIVFSHDKDRDASGPLGSLTVADGHIRSLVSAYRQAGIDMTTAERIRHDELAAYETTWSKRLAFGRPRAVWRLRGTATEPPAE